MTSPNAVVSRRYRIEGMECAGCAAGIQSALTKRPEVSAASVDFLSGMATVEGLLEPEAVCELVRRRGFGAEEIETAAAAASAASGGDERSDVRADLDADDFALADADEECARIDAALRERANAWKRRACIGIGLWLPMELLHWLGHRFLHHGSGALAVEVVLLIGATLAIVLAGGGFYASAWRAGRHGRASMDTLVAMGVTSAYLLSLGTFIAQRFDLLVGAPLWFAEATALLGIIALGHWLEARATARASSATRELLALQPERCERFAADGTIEVVPSRGVRRGDRLLVRPGGRVPVDGRIVEGRAAIDEQALTGEPLPVARGVGETLRAGSIAIDGALTLEATVHGDRTTLLRIAALVQRAQSSKAPVQRLADRIAAVFVPAVLLVAAATLVGWSLAGLWLEGVLAATTVLVISCPCALGIATPMAIMVGTGAASRRGMLIKDAATLERAASVAHVVFDKTGTLTLGQPTVTSVEAVTPFEASEVLRLAAAVEIHSEHPIGKAIVRAASGPQPTATQGVHGFEALPGLGVRARVDGAMVEVLRDAVASCRVVRDGTLVGRITVSDTPRAGAAEAIAMLRATEGTRSIHMLTGDRAEGARAIGAAIALQPSEIVADATPDSKVAHVRGLRASAEGSATVLLVGDGINDAAALAEADVGVAMGGGTAIAIEAAPIVLLSEDPRAVPALLRVAKATMRCVRQNLVLAFAYNTIAIPAAAFGLLGPRGPLIAAAAMALSNLSVVGNALRLRRRLARLEVR